MISPDNVQLIKLFRSHRGQFFKAERKIAHDLSNLVRVKTMNRKLGII